MIDALNRKYDVLGGKEENAKSISKSLKMTALLQHLSQQLKILENMIMGQLKIGEDQTKCRAIRFG